MMNTFNFLTCVRVCVCGGGGVGGGGGVVLGSCGHKAPASDPQGSEQRVVIASFKAAEQ